VLLALTLMIGCSFAFAQTKTISGVVTGSDLPLPGVNVKIKGGNTGAVTDFDGIYKIDANEGDVLEFSSLGFVSQSVTIASETVIDINLVEDVKTLDEVVVIGYGSVSKKDLTGSVVSIKQEEVNRTQPVSFEQALVANAPGVRVVSSEGGPGAGLKVQVRGNTSILASGDPLYVVDGFPIIDGTSNGVSNSAGADTGFGGGASVSPLATLDPADIKSIEVLKDASATAIYGARGANGVVLITTKSGVSGKTKINFTSTLGVSRVARHLDLLGAQEYVNFFNETFPYLPDLNGSFAERFVFESFRDREGNALSLNDERIQPVDFRDLVFRDAIVQKHNLSVSGGGEKSRYFASFGYLDQEGVIRGSDFTRFSANLKVDGNLSDKLKVGVNANLGFTTNNGAPTSVFEGSNNRAQSGLITTLSLSQPVIPNENRLTRDPDIDQESIVRDPDSGFITQLTRNGEIETIFNPLSVLNATTNVSNRFTVNAGLYLDYKFNDFLSFKTTFGGRVASGNRKFFLSNINPWARRFDGIGSRASSLSLNYSLDNIFTYKRVFGDAHNLTSIFGQTLQQSSFENSSLTRRGFLSQRVNFDNLNNGAFGEDDVRSNAASSILESYLARFQYNYDRRYYLTLSGRYDGSSRFRKGSRWGFFPSAAVRWNVSNESFMDNVKFIGDFNLRASLGLAGNERIPFGVSQGIAQIRGRDITIPRVDNPDLTWETTQQLDLGTEISFFNSRRLRLGVDYYEKTTKDLLFFLPVRADLGLRINLPGIREDQFGVYSNLGQISNKGLELSLGADLIKSENFKWTVDANVTFSKNKIEELDVPEDRLIISSPFERRVRDDFLIAEGIELGSFYGYQADGIYRYEDFVEFDGLSEAEAARLYTFGADAEKATANKVNALRSGAGDNNQNNFTLKPGVARFGNQTTYRPGLQKFKDLDGDGVVTLEGGFTNSLSYKNFDLSFQFNWSYGSEILNKNINSGIAGRSDQNKFGLIRDRFTVKNTQTNIPSTRGRGDIISFQPRTDSSLVEDGSYLRLGNISVAYKLPKDMIQSIGLQGLKITGSVNNVYVWTNYSGYDPDTSVGNTALTPGIDFDAYPRARTFILGLNAQF